MLLRRTAGFLLAAALFLSLAASLPAQREADDDAIRKLYTDFFQSLQQGAPAAAVASLRQSGSIDAATAQTLERRLQNERFEFAVGRAEAWTPVTEMEIPQALRYRSFTFLTYHENGPVAWRLRFYEKVTGRWVISNVTFDTQFIEDFVRLSPLEFAGYQALLVLAARERRDRTEP